MKKTVCLLFTLFLLASQTIAQEKSLPNVEVKTLKGKTFNIQNLDNDGKPMVKFLLEYNKFRNALFKTTSSAA